MMKSQCICAHNDDYEDYYNSFVSGSSYMLGQTDGSYHN